MSDKKTPWTPGPWGVFDKGNATLQVGLPPATGENPCIVHWSGFDSSDQSKKMQKANARLIAAAPEMAELLKRWQANNDAAAKQQRVPFPAVALRDETRALLARIAQEEKP